MVEITLTEEDIKMSEDVAKARQLASINRRDAHGLDLSKKPKGYNMRINLIGACAECAVAKYLGLTWNTKVNEFKKPDVFPHIQVKWTGIGHLIFRGPCQKTRAKGDNPDHKYYLVTGKLPTLRIVGWMNGTDAKQEKYFTNAPDPTREKAYFVPISDITNKL